MASRGLYMPRPSRTTVGREQDEDRQELKIVAREKSQPGGDPGERDQQPDQPVIRAGLGPGAGGQGPGTEGCGPGAGGRGPGVGGRGPETTGQKPAARTG